MLMTNSGTRDASEGVRSMIMLTAWKIWKERNNRVFQRSSRTLEQVFRAIQDEARTWVRPGNRGLEELLPSLEQPPVDAINPL